MNSMMAK